jgi:hypothetical protein
MVREAIQSAVPARRKKTERPHLKMASAAALIEAILESDHNRHDVCLRSTDRSWEKRRFYLAPGVNERII